MKRNMLCLLLALCLALSPLPVRAAAAMNFYDLPPENWAYAYVQTLAAEGVTIVDDIHYIERGYEAFPEKLRGLGAEIDRVSTEKEVQKFRLKVS